MSDLNTFREESRAWLEENCPEEMRNLSFHWEDAHLIYARPEADVWLKRMADKGWVAPTWPKEYGGGGLSASEAVVLSPGRLESLGYPGLLKLDDNGTGGPVSQALPSAAQDGDGRAHEHGV